MNVLRRERASIVERSLPDTKLPENPGELFFAGDFAGDFSEIVERAADIECEQITG